MALPHWMIPAMCQWRWIYDDRDVVIRK
jgi:hypothetical protein